MEIFVVEEARRIEGADIGAKELFVVMELAIGHENFSIRGQSLGPNSCCCVDSASRGSACDETE